MRIPSIRKWSDAGRAGRRRWLLITTIVLIGVIVGLGAFTFVYARGASYLTINPAACANCHIMRDHFGAWLKSSRRSVAVCNDCRAPHNLAGKYMTKARNGFWHSSAKLHACLALSGALESERERERERSRSED
jgi:cytochrome c nitrite reductase small subunit